MNNYQNAFEGLEKFDTVIGTVVDTNSSGCYVRDSESGKLVFYFGGGMRGDKVQLSVKRIDTERKRVTCVLDSVLEYGDFVA